MEMSKGDVEGVTNSELNVSAGYLAEAASGREVFAANLRPSVSTVVVDTIAFAIIGFMNLTMISSNMFTGYWHMLDPWNLGFSLWGVVPPFFGYVILPCIFCTPFFWRLLRDEKFRCFFRLATVVFYATMTQVSPTWRTIAIMVGTGLAIVQFLSAITMTEMLGVGNGMFLMLTSRWALSSLNAVDLQQNWVPAWGFYICGFLAVAWLYASPSHVSGVRIEKCNPEVPAYFTWMAAWVVADVVILHSWLFTSDAVIVRWAKLDSYPAGMIIVFALLLGVVMQYAWYMLEPPRRDYVSFGAAASTLIGGILLSLNVGKSTEFQEVYEGSPAMIMVGGFLMALALPTIATVSLTGFKLGMESLRARIRFLFVALSGFFMFVIYGFLFLWLVGKMAADMAMLDYIHGNVALLLPLVFVPIVIFIPLIDWTMLRSRSDCGFAEIDVSATKYAKAMAIVWGLILFAVFLPGLRMRSWHAATRGSLDTPTTFTAMSWNIQEGYEAYVAVDGRAAVGMSNLERQSDVIKTYSPHVVCLQESDSAHPLTGARDLPGFLGERGGYYVEYGAPGYLATPGVATMTSLPTTYQDVYMMPRKTAALNRLLVQVGYPYYDPIALVHKEIHVFNTHTEWFDEEARIAQVAFIKEKIAATTGPAVFMGDFNMNMSMLAPIWNPDQGAVMLPVNMTGHPADAQGLDFFTEIVGDPPGQGAKLTLDHMFYRDLCLVGFKVPQVYGVSDHLPILATFSTHDLTTGLPCTTGPITWDKINNPPKIDRANSP